MLSLDILHTITASYIYFMDIVYIHIHTQVCLICYLSLCLGKIGVFQDLPLSLQIQVTCHFFDVMGRDIDSVESTREGQLSHPDYFPVVFSIAFVV